MGAAGSGVSTLGRALAQRIGGEHFDTDDFCWLPTDPPFRKQREISERLKLLEDSLRGSDRWVLSGSLTGWGEAFVPLFDLVVFLYVPTEVRLKRLQVRERERFGDALDPGGEMHEQHQAFLAWAAGYDEGRSEPRTLRAHETWLATLPCPVLRLDGVAPTGGQICQVLSFRPDQPAENRGEAVVWMRTSLASELDREQSADVEE